MIQIQLGHTSMSSESDLKESFLNEHFKRLGNLFIKDTPRKFKELNEREEMLKFYRSLGLSCRIHSAKHQAAQFIFFYKKFKEMMKKQVEGVKKQQ